MNDDISFKARFQEAFPGERMPLFRKSRHMDQLLNLAVKTVRRGRYPYLIADPGDGLELPAFAEEITDILGHATVHIVDPGADSILWHTNVDDCARSMRGIMIPSADTLTEGMRQQLNRISQNDICNRLVIATFPSRKRLNADTTAWPRNLRRRFSDRALEWPELRRRKDDWPAMLQWGMERITAILGVKKPLTLSESAIALLSERPSGTVRALFDRLLAAALRITGHNKTVITAVILRDSCRIITPVPSDEHAAAAS